MNNQNRKDVKCNHPKHWINSGVCEVCGAKMCNPPLSESCDNEPNFVSCCTEKYVCKRCYDNKFGCVCIYTNTISKPITKEEESTVNSTVKSQSDLISRSELIEWLKGQLVYCGGKPEPREDYQCDCGYDFDDCHCEHNRAIDSVISKLKEEKV